MGVQLQFVINVETTQTRKVETRPNVIVILVITPILLDTRGTTTSWEKTVIFVTQTTTLVIWELVIQGSVNSVVHLILPHTLPETTLPRASTVIVSEDTLQRI